MALTLLFGVHPKPVLDMSAAAVTQLLDNYNHAIAAAKTAALAHDPEKWEPVFGKIMHENLLMKRKAPRDDV